MKRYPLIPAFLLTLCLCASSCNKKQDKDQAPAPPPQATASPAKAQERVATTPFSGGRKTSFQEVTSQLDPGGSVFVYMATDQWLASLSKTVLDFREIVLALPGPGMENRDEIERGFGLISRLIKTSGMEDVTGVGLSGAPVAPDLFRNKLVLHHQEGSGQGFLWSMFGRAPHALQGQDMLPANTVLAAFGDLDVTQVWEVLQRELNQSGIKGATEMARSFPQMFEKQTQIPWTPLLESLGGEVGVLLTLDESKRVSIPAGRKPIELPSPALLIAIKVKNELLYERVSAQLSANPKSLMSEEAGLKLCSITMDAPLPIPIVPTVASSGDFFYFSTSPDLVRKVQATRQGKSPGLKSSAEFQNLSKHLPSKGNQFVYISQAFGKTVTELQQQALGQSGMPQEQLTVLEHLLGLSKPGYSLSIGAHTPTGWQTTSVGNQDSASGALILPTVGITAVGAGMILPALAKAKARAQSINSVSQLKQLGLAARMYSNDHKNKFPNAKRWCDDIKEFVETTKVFKAANDPSAGPCSYAFNEKLSGMDENQINPQTVLFFEAEAGWNRSGGPELLLRQPRSAGTYVVGFADGSVQQISAARLQTLRWDP
jgi:hypothetical protein